MWPPPLRLAKPRPCRGYLRGRTAFFDRLVVRTLEHDGRSLRSAKPGVQWFEVDHPDTQGDERARLDQLGINASHVSFVPFDLRSPGLARNAGFVVGAPDWGPACGGARSEITV